MGLNGFNIANVQNNTTSIDQFASVFYLEKKCKLHILILH